MKNPAHTYLVPGEGLRVAKPEGGYLDPEGEAIALTGYWRRRISCGDVVVVKKPKTSGSSRSGSSSSNTQN